MRRRIGFDGASALAAGLVLFFLAGARAAASEEHVLERYPVCEASAALEVPCAGGEGDERACVWVGDNEHDADLFSYDASPDGRLVPSARWKVRLGDARVDDIEALAREGGSVLVFGSHGRDSKCRARPTRAAVARVEVRDRAAHLLSSGGGWQERLERCDGGLIARAPEAHDGGAGEDELRRAVCAAIADAEHAAQRAAGDRARCKGDSFNVEGAVGLAGADGRTRVWLGLRAPLLGGRAILLRLVPGIVRDGNVAFDGVATVDLAGRGVRELAYADGFVWGIAGSVQDGERPSRLWRIPAGTLTSGATISQVETVVETLPPTAEGLVVQPGERRAIVLLDGDTGKKKRCAVPARQLVVPVP